MTDDPTAVSATVPKPLSRPRNRRGRRLIWIALALIGAALGANMIWQPFAETTSEVAVENVVAGPVTRILAVNGQLAAIRSVVVRAPVSGTLVALLADAGDQVTVGDVLTRIDASQQDAVVRQATAALDEGRLRVAQAQSDYDRALSLSRIVAPVVQQNAANALETAQQEVGRLTAMLDQAKIELDRYTVTAPITGTVIERGVDGGQFVDPSIALFTVADLTELVVETDVDETYATQITTGQRAVLRLVGTPQNLDGQVSFVSPRVDPQTGGLAVKIAFDTPLSAPVGLTVTANIIVDEQSAAITVPRTALVQNGDDVSVLLFDDGIARQVAVRVIDWPAARLIVTDGLTEGDALILDAEGIADGQAVRRALARTGR